MQPTIRASENGAQDGLDRQEHRTRGAVCGHHPGAVPNSPLALQRKQQDREETVNILETCLPLWVVNMRNVVPQPGAEEVDSAKGHPCESVAHSEDEKEPAEPEVHYRGENVSDEAALVRDGAQIDPALAVLGDVALPQVAGGDVQRGLVAQELAALLVTLGGVRLLDGGRGNVAAASGASRLPGCPKRCLKSK